MRHIGSRDNPTYKRLVRIARGKERDSAILEGVHLCQAWLRHRGMPDLALFDAARLEKNPELGALLNAVPGDRAVTCEPNLMRGVSAVEHGQGVCFVVRPPGPSLPPRIRHSCVLLDTVQDPGNLGTILRTTAAAGIRDVFLSAGCAHAWSQKVLRSAQGAHFVLAIHEHLDLRRVRQRLAVPLVATALAGAQSLYSAELDRQCAWLFGNEGQGVSAPLLDLADVRVRIPQAAQVESLNVGVAAAICLFEHRRRYPVPEECAAGGTPD